MTPPNERSTILDMQTYTKGDFQEYTAQLHAAATRRPASTGWWVLEGILPAAIYDKLEKRRSAGSVAGRLSVREITRQRSERNLNGKSTWHNASEFVRSSMRLLGNKRLGSGKKIPLGWLNGRLAKPHVNIENAHDPNRETSVPGGKESVYTDVTDLDVVTDLFDIEQNPGLTYEMTVFVPFTERLKRDNFMKSPAKFTTEGYTKLGAILRISDDATVSSRRLRIIERSECQEAESEALYSVTEQIYNELHELRRNSILGVFPGSDK